MYHKTFGNMTHPIDPRKIRIIWITMSDFLSSIQEVSYVVLDYFRILRPKKCLQDFTRNFEDFERGDSLL